MFLAVVIFGFTPLPFDLMRMMAVVSGYPKIPYLIAVFIGRVPRYYLVALLGTSLQLPTWVIVLSIVLITAYGWIASIMAPAEKKENKAMVQKEQSIDHLQIGKAQQQ